MVISKDRAWGLSTTTYTNSHPSTHLAFSTARSVTVRRINSAALIGQSDHRKKMVKKNVMMAAIRPKVMEVVRFCLSVQ